MSLVRCISRDTLYICIFSFILKCFVIFKGILGAFGQAINLFLDPFSKFLKHDPMWAVEIMI